MGRMYVSTFTLPLDSIGGLFYVSQANPIDKVHTVLHRILITQVTAKYDVESEQVAFKVIRCLSGGGGNVASSYPLQSGDPACKGNIVRNTGEPSGLGEIVDMFSMNVLIGVDRNWVPETRPHIPINGDELVIMIDKAASSGVSGKITVYWEEIGG